MKFTEETKSLKQFINEEENSVEVRLRSSGYEELFAAIDRFLEDNPTFRKLMVVGDNLVILYEPVTYDDEPEGCFPWEKPGMSVKDFF